MTCKCPGLRLYSEGMLVISVEDMRAYEVNTVWLGIPLVLLMENAGRAIADLIECKLGDLEGKRVVVYAGRGGNGGDGVVAARHLAARGAEVTVYMVYPRELISHPDTRLNVEALRRSDSIEFKWVRSPSDLGPVDADAVIDALLGVGVRGRLREPVASAAKAVNESSGLKVAVDVPSGLDPDTGTAAEGTVEADATVTMHAAKRGLVASEARRYVGELWVAEIGIPSEAWELAGPGDVAARIPVRPRDAHKGVGGRVLVVGGSSLYYGAPALAAVAAYRAGADLVYLVSPRRVAEAAASWDPHIIPRSLEGDHLGPGHVERALAEASRAHAVVLGPGLGLAEETRAVVRAILEELKGKPVVIDADGLKHIVGAGPLWPEAILTPHRGEAAKLAGREGEPGELAKFIAREYNATVIVKGPVDYICGPSGRCRRNITGHPAMSTGGTGDVLSGVVAAFAARRASLGLSPDPLNVAAAAAYVVGVAGEKAVERRGEGITALDVALEVPGAIRDARRVLGQA